MSEPLSAEVRPGVLNRWGPRHRKCEEVATFSLLPAETHSQPYWGWRAWREHPEGIWRPTEENHTGSVFPRGSSNYAGCQQVPGRAERFPGFPDPRDAGPAPSPRPAPPSRHTGGVSFLPDPVLLCPSEFLISFQDLEDLPGFFLV